MTQRSLPTALRIGADSLRINPLRSALSALGMIIGVASLVAVLSLGDGMERTARAQLQTTSPIQAIAISSRTNELLDGDALALRDTVPLTQGDLGAIAALPGVSWAQMSLQTRQEVRLDTVRRVATLRGTLGRTADSPLAAGRSLGIADTAATVLSALLARRIAPGRDVTSLLGSSLAVGGIKLLVVGVEAPRAGPPIATAEVPFAVVESIVRARTVPLPTLLVEAARIEDVATVQGAIERHLGGRASSVKRQFSIETYKARAEQAAQGILIFKLLMGAITGISLLVGGIGIMNVLLASVSERTREIGIRRAAGATRRDILLQFLSESVAISALGSVIGVVIGLTGSFALTALIRRFAQAAFVQSAFSVSSLVAAAGASVLVGLAFGTYPARRAARLDPIDAIRHE